MDGTHLSGKLLESTAANPMGANRTNASKSLFWSCLELVSSVSETGPPIFNIISSQRMMETSRWLGRKGQRPPQNGNWLIWRSKSFSDPQNCMFCKSSLLLLYKMWTMSWLAPFEGSSYIIIQTEGCWEAERESSTDLYTDGAGIAPIARRLGSISLSCNGA